MLAPTFLTRKTGIGEPKLLVEDSDTVPSVTHFTQLARRGEDRTKPSPERASSYDCFSIVNAIVVPRCLSVYSALIDLPSLDTVMR